MTLILVKDNDQNANTDESTSGMVGLLANNEDFFDDFISLP